MTVALQDRIEELHPWFYPVEIDGTIVVPGIGSKDETSELIKRTRYRQILLVEEIQKRYDFTGKHLLDLASNCGYWSAQYARLGAKRVLAVEGRGKFVKQGLIYWERNRFLPPDSYQFMRGNVMDEAVWKTITSMYVPDFTLCCGILYHVGDYRWLLGKAAAVTREAILIDTRVGDDDKKLIQEPDGWYFNAIRETSLKTVPTVRGIMEAMKELGFKVERIRPDRPMPPPPMGGDDYEKDLRMTFFATRP